MLKSLIKALGVVVGLALSGIACAVSLGGINVTTALGEPLKAVVALETANSNEASKLSARLASPDAFKNAGVDYPYGLPLLTFQIETNPINGQSYLKITSAQPINEPFVNLLVELDWPSGKLLREYTFLLDPPGYVVEQPMMAEVQPVEPSVAVLSPEFESQGEEVKAEPEISQAEPESPAPASEEKELVEPAPAPVAADEPAKSSNVISGTIKVKRGDTLHKLATQAKSPDISLERMLVALYRANADAFDGKNMNRLKTGKILQVPQQAELDDLEQSEAVQEIRVQAADWHAYRQKLAAASKQVTDEKAKQEVSGKISTQVEDKTPAAKESAKEVVRLSKGESPTDKTVAGGSAKSPQDKAQTVEEEAIARKKTIQESNERVAMLEKNIKAMQRLAELKSQMAAEQAPKQADAAAKEKSGKLEALPKVPVPVAGAISDVSASSEVLPALPPPKPKVVTQPSIVDEILGQPLYLAGIAAAILALLGFGFVRSRRGKSGLANKGVTDSKEATKDAGGTGGRLSALFTPLLRFVRRRRDKSNVKEEAEDVGSSSGRIMTPVAPSPETGDFTKTLVSKTALTHAPTDEVDPISEADLFLNFGRDEQAEEILKEALTKNPANHLIRLKLLSIYANRKDANTFSTIARQLKDSGDVAAWEQAATMGRKLEPNNPMYGGDDSVSAAIKAPAPTVGSDTMIDVGTVKKQAAVMDFDLGAGTVKMPVGSAETLPPAEPDPDKTAVLNTPMDFDITGSHTNVTAPEPGNVEAPEVQLDDLIFDVTTSHDDNHAEKASKAVAPAEPEESISFLLDFPGVSKSEYTPPQVASSAPMNIGLGEINLNLDEPAIPAPATGSPSAPPVADTPDDDVATKLDLAKAYQEMGDSQGAREILDEVVRDGNAQQRTAAEALLKSLSA